MEVGVVVAGEQHAIVFAGRAFPVPSCLVMGNGANRARSVPNLTGAENDLDAIERWIAFRAANPNTARSYRTHAFRLLVWSISFRGKGLSDLNIDDLGAFFDWLTNPQPHASWDGLELTRGPLKDSSRIKSMTIIQALFTWLVDGGYLAGNPLRLARFASAAAQQSSGTTALHDEQTVMDRYLPFDVFDWLRDYAVRQIANAREQSGPISERTRGAIRDRYLLEWIYWCGARRSEVPTASMASVRQEQGVWVWRVLGKGNKIVDYPIEDAALDALVQYRLSLGLPEHPRRSEQQIPLVGRLRARGDRVGLTGDQIYRSLKQFFREAAKAAQTENPDWADRLSRSTTHWLRHTYLSHLVLDGADLEFTARRGRHGSVQTTKKHYVHRTIKEESEHLQRLRGKS